MITRCINIDWLEVYCIEPQEFFPLDAAFFTSHGYQCQEREYGTRVWSQMFTIYGSDGERLLEIRRAPKSASGFNSDGILDPKACHVRLCNRTCYFDNAVDAFRTFLYQWRYTVMRISRIDIALDFEYFDYGDDPSKFLQRYLENRYAKINQADIAPHGRDAWDGRTWNSISWGSKTSCISTKFYNKTMELREVSDKPYIRQAWHAAGLIDDWFTLEKRRADGTVYKPTIWRVEFSIKSGTRNWFLIENQSGKRVRKQSIRNTLAMYDTRQKLLDMFFSLADHYFHFKYREYIETKKPLTATALSAIAIDYKSEVVRHTKQPERRLQRKDRCHDKRLFRTNDVQNFYKLENVASAKPSSKPLKKLVAMLIQYRDEHPLPDVFKACTLLIEKILNQEALEATTVAWPMDELTILRTVIAKRIKGSTATLGEDIETTRALLSIQEHIFGEHDTRTNKTTKTPTK